MRLLFDENLSPRLVRDLDRQFPGSSHVRDQGLRGASDLRIWEFCRESGFAVVSKDTDFRDLSFAGGAPPKVVWLRVGNAGTEAIADPLRLHHARVEAFEAQVEVSLLILSDDPSVI